MKYVDLFSGAGGFSKAIEDTFIRPVCMGHSDIDPKALAVYSKHFPTHKNLGPVENIKGIKGLDLLTAGSPCQDLSIAKSNRQGLTGDKSALFYDFLRILERSKPKYFILENVASMSLGSRESISRYLGVPALKIDSALVSAQRRERLYWTNIPRTPIEDREVYVDNLVAWSRSGRKPKDNGSVLPHWKVNTNGKYFEERERRDGKANTLTTGFGCASFSSCNFLEVELNGTQVRRHLTTNECEILQTFPLGWCDVEGLSVASKYRLMGNAVTVEIIKEILKGLV